MNQNEFNGVVKATMDTTAKLLLVKGGEYAGSEDRLANFKRGAQLTGVTPLQCLFIYMSKHYDALATFIRDDAAGRDRPRSESIEGRADDIINYCILFKALLEDRRGPVKEAESGGDPGRVGRRLSNLDGGTAFSSTRLESGYQDPGQSRNNSDLHSDKLPSRLPYPSSF